jgi:hypothetical protein
MVENGTRRLRGGGHPVSVICFLKRRNYTVLLKNVEPAGIKMIPTKITIIAFRSQIRADLL